MNYFDIANIILGGLLWDVLIASSIFLCVINFVFFVIIGFVKHPSLLSNYRRLRTATLTMLILTMVFGVVISIIRYFSITTSTHWILSIVFLLIGIICSFLSLWEMAVDEESVDGKTILRSYGG